MLDTVFGLPVHPLIVHAATVIVPAAALLHVVARRERQSTGLVTPREGAATARAAGRSAGVSAVPRWLLVGAAVVGLVASLGTATQVVRIGHSGAQAAWGDAVSQTTSPAGGDDGN